MCNALFIILTIKCGKEIFHFAHAHISLAFHKSGNFFPEVYASGNLSLCREGIL